MTIQPHIPGRPHGAWAASCGLCMWDKTIYRSEDAARHGAAAHLWGHRTPAAPRLCETTGKRRHLSRELALEHIRSLYRAGIGNPDYHPYQCPACHSWHVGHSKHRLTQRVRAALPGRRRTKRKASK